MKYSISLAAISALIVLGSAGVAEAKTTTQELVGYTVTTTQMPTKSEYFLNIDTNDDGWIDLKEFQAKAQLEDEYNTFITIDRDGNDLLDMYEYGAFNKTQGKLVTKSDGETRAEAQEGEEAGIEAYSYSSYIPVKNYNFNQQ